MTRKDRKVLAVALATLTVFTASGFHIVNKKAEEFEAKYTTFVAIETNAETLPEIEPITVDSYEAELVGRTIWGEAGGVKSEAERAAVAWCILNRVDAYGKSIEEVVTAPQQFQGYRPRGTCPPEHIELATDVIIRWQAEKQGRADVGRVLPADYLYFMGDGKHNHFTTEYLGTDYWDWSLTDPYKI
jgi:hypothetical protein